MTEPLAFSPNPKEAEVTDEKPLACSLDAGELEPRLAAIAAVGAEGLIAREAEGECHLLRFRSDPATRRRLEDIVAAEAKCCSFLDLSLTESGDELVLAIAAPAAGRPVADQLAQAFSAR